MTYFRSDVAILCFTAAPFYGLGHTSEGNDSQNPQSNSKHTSKSSARRKFTCDDAPTYFTCRDAKHLIGQWFEVKENLFGSKYSKSAAAEFLVGKAYNKYVNGNLTNELSIEGIYYIYNQTFYAIKNIQEIDNNLIMVRATIAEDRTTYPTNIIKHIKKTSFCYEFQKVDSKWKLSRTPDLISNCKKN